MFSGNEGIGKALCFNQQSFSNLKGTSQNFLCWWPKMENGPSHVQKEETRFKTHINKETKTPHLWQQNIGIRKLFIMSLISFLVKNAFVEVERKDTSVLSSQSSSLGHYTWTISRITPQLSQKWWRQKLRDDRVLSGLARKARLPRLIVDSSISLPTIQQGLLIWRPKFLSHPFPAPSSLPLSKLPASLTGFLVSMLVPPIQFQQSEWLL